MSAPDIFLSYSREDQVRAKLFADAFKAQGLDVWWDVGLIPGEAYDEVTETALRTAKAVVVLWSKKSVASRWVRAEATLADRNKTLVPCMIEPCERPIMFELTQTAELSHWQGDAMDKAWLTFLAGVRRFVEKQATPDVAPGLSVPIATPAHTPAKRGERGDAPSLAVLPFTNRSTSPEDDVFALGMVADLVDALSQGVHCRVLASSTAARLSTGSLSDLQAVGRVLGVRYLLEGNVRRTGNDIRVTAQLIEAASGEIRWTQKFDKPLSKLADLQEELVREVASQMGARVYQLELERVLDKPADHTAWEAAMRSLAYFRNQAQPDIEGAITQADRALAIAPDYGLAHAMLAHARGVKYFYSSPDDPTQAQVVCSHAEAAVRLAPNHALALTFAGQSYCYAGNPEKGLYLAERALKESPSVVEGHYTCGLALLMLNRWDDAIDHLTTDIAIMPGNFVEPSTLAFISLAHFGAKRLDQAQIAVAQSLRLAPEGFFFLTIDAVLKSYVQKADAARESFLFALKFAPTRDLTTTELLFRRLFRGHPIELAVRQHLNELYAATKSGGVDRAH